LFSPSLKNSRIVQAAFEAFIKSDHKNHGSSTDYSKLKDADIGKLKWFFFEKMTIKNL
jgi:hypothetical protein